MIARTASLYTLLFALVLALGGCKKDDFARETMAELQKLADDIATSVEDAEDKKAGVAAGQKLLDDKKGELLPKMKEVMELRGFQVSEEVAAEVNKVRMDAGMKVASLELSLVGQTAQDPELEKALDKLTTDFTNLVDGT